MHEKVKNINLNFISGNDYNSSIFRKGKKTCFKVMKCKAAYIDMFRLLGDHLDPIELLPSIEQFICQLFGMKKSIKSVNEARYELFTRRLRKNGIIDISVLPPSRSVLDLHVKRSALIHYLWKQSKEAVIHIPDISDSGWFPDGEICFTADIFPAELQDIFAD
jgi:hypothetical protein